MPKIKALPPNTEGLQGADVLPMHNDSSDDTEKVSIEQIRTHITWTPAEETWSYSSWSSTTRIGIITVPTDATTKYSAGMRVVFSQSTGGTKYGIIVAVSATTLTVFFPSGTTFNNETISSPQWSTVKVPFGFNPDPSVWSLSLVDSTDRTINASPDGSSWYNNASLVLTIGIGAWRLYGNALARFTRSAGGTGASLQGALSTSTSSVSDSELVAAAQLIVTFSTGGTGTYTATGPLPIVKNIVLAAQTTYNFIFKAGQAGSALQVQGSTLQPTIIRATCNYL